MVAPLSAAEVAGKSARSVAATLAEAAEVATAADRSVAALALAEAAGLGRWQSVCMAALAQSASGSVDALAAAEVAR